MDYHIFSVIIPHHNIPELLQRCLDSIPDVPEVQVIVVDDNSSAEKVDFEHFPGLQRNNTTCIFDKDGGGAGHARNIGLRHADGKWLVFADSDDFFMKDAFGILDKHKDALQDIILFKSNSVNSDDLSPSDRFQDVNQTIDYTLSGMISAKQAVLRRPGPVCKMFRNSYIQRKSIWFDETKVSNDTMFVTKAACWTDDKAVTVSDEVLYTVTTRRGSLIDGRLKDVNNFLNRLEVQIRQNRFLKDYPQFRKDPIILQLIPASQISKKAVFRTFIFILKKRALFSGFDTFLRIVKSHITGKKLLI
jgi:glycosyltransferase involved in cell wall biosynthesis